MEGVSATARWTAAARAEETRREDRLFTDALAADLAGPEGFARYERYANPGTTEFLAIRTRYLDDVIARHAGLAQVVLVAAGLDTRSARLDWPDGTVLYELDQPDLVEWKEKRLAELDARHRCDRRPVGTDLTGPWEEELAAAGWDQAVPTLWIVEGLLFYLPEAGAHGLLERLAFRSAPGSVLAGDLLGHQSMVSEFTQDGLRRLREDGCPWLWGTDRPEDVLAACGWRVADLKVPGEDGASYGRWPWPPLPRDTVGLPMNHLFTAAR
ncbi:class I SAM-dependent methyltransferase [Actinomadura macrotermitis]|uniref:S-adenosyl-L-methionine-dependent methyltransferase n=1 Tax=Actinomadura macrotermitis TaxID=2585200 RepID=A0A7K0BZE3_9ACTN|nr:SAM-dependent methyltransferase [Actinomadura macrotermitis]MQY06550.1 putative S-adenosyl-L-methionine-dependent methyltransferase [Actinomadura macrotermitis]